jgi:hypothetical protein
VKGNRVLAVAGMNRDREMAAIEELMRLDRLSTSEHLSKTTWTFWNCLMPQS